MPTTAKLISRTESCIPHVKTGEELLAYNARMSNPKGQEEQTAQTAESLIRTCIRRSHWSVLESAHLCIEITTTRDIAAQIIRHKSFSFQEFSQRYSSTELLSEDLVAEIIEGFEPRLQDTKNRQSSLSIKDKWKKRLIEAIAYLPVLVSVKTYLLLLKLGIAKEVARRILPMSTPTRIAINGNIRSWFFYLLVRNDPATQKEHRLVAEAAEAIFKEEFPIVHECLMQRRMVDKADSMAWTLMEKARKSGKEIVGWEVKPVYKRNG